VTSTGGKLWFVVAALATVASALYWLGTGRGEWFGTLVLFAVAVGALLLGITATQLGDGDVDAVSDTDVVPVRRTLPAAWPALAAVGGGLALVGLAGGTALLYVGIGVLAVVTIEWAIQGWAERATGDHRANKVVRDTLMSPIEIPLVAILAIAFVVLSFSRVFLALPKTGTIVAAGVLAVAILGIATLIASRPHVSGSLVTGLLALAAVAVLVGGIAGLSTGTREFEKHHATEDTTTNGDAPSPTTTVKP
jgi:hypothetical protein